MRYLQRREEGARGVDESEHAAGNALLASGAVEVAPAEGQGGELSAACVQRRALLYCVGGVHLSMTASSSFALGTRSGTWRASKFFM